MTIFYSVSYETSRILTSQIDFRSVLGRQLTCIVLNTILRPVPPPFDSRPSLDRQPLTRKPHWRKQLHARWVVHSACPREREVNGSAM